MKDFTLIAIVLTFGLALIFLRKGEKSNTAPDGTEIEPLSKQEKIVRGLDLTIEGIKEKIQSTRKKPLIITTDDPGFVGGVPDNSKMMDYENPDGNYAFHHDLKRTRGSFNHIDQ